MKIDNNIDENDIWVKSMKRYHRYSFTKGKLINDGFDKNKTEREIMRNIGYYRIYDSGQKRWKYDA